MTVWEEFTWLWRVAGRTEHPSLSTRKRVFVHFSVFFLIIIALEITNQFAKIRLMC